MRRRDIITGGSALLGMPLVPRPLAAAPPPAVPPIPAILHYEQASGGHVGLYARNLRTGRRMTWRADERFVMCSTFKASLAALVLRRCGMGKDSLASPVPFTAADIHDWHAPVAKANLAEGFLSVEAMGAAAVEESDNTCANLLLARIGGPAALTTFWRQLGDDTTRLDAAEPELNRTPPGGVENTTTPAAMARIMQVLLGPVIPRQTKHLFLDWMKNCRTGANRLRAGVPAGWTVGDKTGNNGADAAGDIAYLWPDEKTIIVAAVYTRGGSPTPAQLDALFAGIGHALATDLAGGPVA